MAERETGTVKWFSTEKGYGFIARDQKKDVFVHYSELRNQSYPWLEEGQQVEFSVVQTGKGFQAQDVIVVV